VTAGYVCEEPRPGFFADVPGCHRNRTNVQFLTFLRDIDGIFHEDDRIVIGESDAPAPQILRRTRDRFRTCRRRQRVELAGLADIPVLAETASEVTAGGAEGKDGRAGQEMVQGFLLDRVDTETTRPTVRGQDDLVSGAGANETKTSLIFMQTTVTRAEVTLNPSVIELMPVPGGDNMVDLYVQKIRPPVEVYSSRYPFSTILSKIHSAARQKGS
jgi:hypothetical protein